MAGIGEAASIVGVIQVTAQVVKLCGGYLSEVNDARQDIERLRSKALALQGVLEHAQQIVEDSKSARLPVSNSVLESLKQCVSDLQLLQTKLDPGKRRKVMKSFGMRALKWPFTKMEFEKTVEMLDGYTMTFNTALLADQLSITLEIDKKLDRAQQTTLGIDKKLDQVQQDRLLGALPCVEAAAFNSYDNQHERKCLPQTRVDLLRQVTEWADGSSSKCIFWLNGMAGTGKSTIARTIADQFASKERLAASFFFSKGSGDRRHARHFFSTIAVQMTRTLPSVQTYIHEAITEQPDIAQQAMLDQWNKLILKPLRKARNCQSLLRPIIFVIDALDECGSQGDVQLILRLLANTKDITSLKLRIFLTSRPEIPIRLGFRDMDSIMHQDLVLQDVPRSVIEHDIYLFLKHELNQIRNKRHMGPDWPDEQRLRILVEKADCLFIFAATACLFIDGASTVSPEKRLSDLVLQRTINRLSTKNLDTMYLKILQDSVTGEYTDEEKEEATEQFRRVVGSIVVLFDVLSVAALGSLLLEPSGNATQSVLDVLSSLHSVLNISEDLTQPVRLLHPSFRDFVLDPQRCPDKRFWINDKMIHQRLAEDCLRIMSQHLQKNICNLPSPGFLARDVDDNEVARCVPPHLQYACLYWFNHLREGGCNLRDSGAVHQFLQKHFLCWLEALSLMKKTSDGLSMVLQLESMLMSHDKGSLEALVRDAKRFVLNYRYILEKAPLQIYSSAIIFSPAKSEIRKLFLRQVPGWISTLPEVEKQWGACQQTLEGHSGLVSAVVFSPDGRLVASGSSDKTVRLWDSATAEARGTLEGHSNLVNAVAFSPDGRLVASGSGDRTVRLWDVATGEARGTLEGHSDSIHTVVFSPDGRLVASGSVDRTVRLWDAATGEARGTLEGHSDWVNAVAFSPDGRLVASGSYDKTVRLWDAVTGEARATLEGHSDSVHVVVFSPDRRLVASGSGDKTVRLWDAAAGEARVTLEGHSDSIHMVVFSPDGRLVASGSLDRTVRLWDAATGEARSTLKGHSDWVRAVVFSPDGRLVASGSDDMTVRLWDAATAEARGTLDGHSNLVNAVAFSPDGRLVVSGSGDRTVRLWDVMTSETRGTLEAHSNLVNAVVFSPDGRLVASGSGDKTVRLWDAATGEARGTLEGHSNWVNAVAFSPDGRLVASGSYDKTVRLWDATTGEARGTLEGHLNSVNAVTFSLDGRLVASGSDDETVRLWDAATGEARSTLEGHSKWVNAVVFSPDGRLVASGSGDETVRLWDAATGEARGKLEGHPASVCAVVFSPDGRLVASRAGDKAVRLWDIELKETVRTIECGRYDALSFSPDSSCLNVGANEVGTGLSLNTVPTIPSQPFSLDDTGNWVSSATGDILWLPPDRRPRACAVQGTSIVLGGEGGRMTFLSFNGDADLSI